MRTIKQTPLEIYLRAYVRQHRRYKQNEASLNKALARITEAIRPSCCDNPAAVVNPHTPRENVFTLSVQALIISSRHRKRSMLRCQKILEDYINGTCCAG